MSGHSKWSTIKRQKGAADQKRGMTFTKLANVIALAAKEGGGEDAASNPRLRLALEQARAVNMPKENIQRAIDRGLGRLPGQTFEEVHFEGFGPGKTAFIVTGVTDNKNRTLAEIRNLFDRSGGALGTTGSVGFMFEKKGLIRVVSKKNDPDEEELELIDSGAEDLESYEDEGVKKYLIYTDPTETSQVSKNITQSGFEVESMQIMFKPTIETKINDRELAERVLNFSEKLEDHDDIQSVSSNFDISDEIGKNL
jgi:YebC/PmpR family DNA-binding regulatory protein